MNEQLDMRFLTAKEAAALLRVHVGTLANWRMKGRGPRFHKAESKVLYRMDDLLDYLGEGRTGTKD